MLKSPKGYALVNVTPSKLYKLCIEINGLPKPTNAQKGNWYLKSKEAKKWREDSRNMTIAMRPKVPLVKATLKLTRFSSKCPDYDGLVSSFKHIIDGLVDAGIIEDDNMNIIGMPEFDWVKCKPKQGKIRVIVEGDRDG